MVTEINYNGLGEKFNSNCREIVESLFTYLQSTQWGGNIWCGSGWRSDSAEHSTGLAVDLITSSKVGKKPTQEQFDNAMKLVNVLIRNGEELDIAWILFSIDGKVTHSYNMDRGTWRKLDDRGSVSFNHVDHVHVLFKKTSRLPKSFSWSGVQSIPPEDALPVLSAQVAWGVAVTDYNRNVRTGTVNWSYVSLIQRALNKVYGYSLKVDGIYGNKTRCVYEELQRDMGFTGKDADGFPGYKSLDELAAESHLFTAAK